MIRNQQERECLGEFAEAWPFCWACGMYNNGTNEIDHPRWLEIHHIAKQGRVHETWNLSRLCRLCHDLAEGMSIRHDGLLLPNLTAANVLWLKSMHDWSHYDRLALYSHWRTMDLPMARQPEAFFWDQYERNRGTSYPALGKLLPACCGRGDRKQYL